MEKVSEFCKLILGGAFVGSFFALVVWWVFEVWQIILSEAL